MRVVILAGGKGTRLSPYTSVFPKPLMPMNGVPILQVVISQLKEAGFQHITLAVGYMAEMIQTYFGDGRRFGIKIDYSHETQPLGTVGALALISDLPEDFIVMNGDILTDLDFAKFFISHKNSGVCATIATFIKKVKIEYGVIESNNYQEIIGFKEKPTLNYEVSMGIYVFKSSILKYIDKGCYLDFPDLVHQLMGNNEKILRYGFDGYWMDIGCHADFQKAAEDFEEMKEHFLKEPLPVYQERVAAQVG